MVGSIPATQHAGGVEQSVVEGGILFLVLRFATEFMNRAVVFTVGEDGIRGLGQFGIVDPDGHADARVRDLFIPLKADPLFTRAIDSRMALKGLSRRLTEWNRYLLNELGGERRRRCSSDR